MNQIKRWALLPVFAMLLLYVNAALADPLQPWESWVLNDHQDHACPWVLAGNGTKACIWPERLALEVNNSGGVFTYAVEVYKPSWVALPGSAVNWPDEVLANDLPAKVVERRGLPYVSLEAGRHSLTGRFDWPRRPGQLSLPANVAIVSLRAEGSAQLVDRRQNQLILSRNNTVADGARDDTLSIDVFRLIDDGVPLKLSTQIRLSVSGKAREVTFGRVQLADTEILSIRSAIPARIEADGTMRAQVVPGEHTIEVLARFTGQPSRIQTEKLSDEWPASEYVSFRSAPLVRQASLSGAASIDTRQISIPSAWAQLPTYWLTQDNALTITTEVRGDHSPAANAFNLQRDLWLDFDGGGMTAFDRIDGQMNSGWRLDVAEGVALGRATVDGAPVLITHDNDAQGIEIRSPAIRMEAVTRLDSSSRFSSSGWNAPINHYEATLHLPPGWRVLHAYGVDGVRGTWLSQWDLWDIFLLLIIISATRKLMGNRVAALSAVTFIVALHEAGSPLLIIPILLIIMAVLPLVSGVFKRALNVMSVVLIASLALLMVGFAVERFRLAIYPSLEQAQIGTYQQNAYRQSPVASVSTIAAESVQFDELAEPLSKRAPRSAPKRQNTQPLYPLNENDRVQTGPGLPTWVWNAISFYSSDRVSPDEFLVVYYSKPLVTSVWLVLSVLLVFLYSMLVIVRLAKLGQFGVVKASAGTSASVASMALCGLLALATLPISPSAMAESYPPQYLLEELEARLTAAPECLPDCVSISNGSLRVADTAFTMDISVYADANIALPLPQSDGSWVLRSVTSAGVALPLRQAGETVFVALDKGHHGLTISGDLLAEQAALRLPLPIHNLSVDASGWVVEGLVDGRVRKNILTLRALNQSAAAQVDTLKADPVPSFARVIRHFDFAKRWTINTTVIRETTDDNASLAIALLPNERLLSEVGTVSEGILTLQFEQRQQRIQWSSTMEPSEQLLLQAAEGSRYVEQWSFAPSSLWRLAYKGIPPLKPQAKANAFEPRFKPWPGEQLTVDISKPEGVLGPVYTVENALLKVTAGSQLQQASLALDIRASIGTDYVVTLPEDAEVLALSVDGEVLSTPAGHVVTVPLRPREQKVVLEFQTPQGVALLSHSPQVYLPANATNIQLHYQLPRDRWPLYLSGPSIGPAMLYWGVLVVIVLGAFGLSYLARATQLNIPVSTLGWLLLGLGLSTVNSYGLIAIAIMFFMLAARKAYTDPKTMSPVLFNGMQVGIVFWVIVSVLCLLVAIPMGLLSTPEMKVTGNGSSSHFYRYYQDIAGAEDGLPSMMVVNVPLFAYRVVMLLWSLWLSTRLIKWAIWGWACYKENGMWLALPKVSRKVPHSRATQRPTEPAPPQEPK